MVSHSFIRLIDAIEFLIDRMEAGDVEAISAECLDTQHDGEREVIGLPPRKSYRLRAIRELGRRHEVQNLRTLYQGREFPVTEGKFKLGGHAAELGHIHVDFVRQGTAWKLKEIWICR